MPTRTENALQGHPGEVVGQLTCDGQCVTEEGEIAEVSELRKDPCRCFVNIQDIPDPHSIDEEREEEEEFE